MNIRTLIMISVALVAAAGTALMARGWLNAERAALSGAGKPAHYVLVAGADIPSGNFVKAQQLRWQGWPKGNLSPAYVLQGKRKISEFDGAVVRKGLVRGQPITDMLVVRPGQHGFLAAVLQPGMRAVSVQVNAISGISGFVFPGDRVDLLLTHTVRANGGRRGRASRVVSETALQDIRVLAVDQKTGDQKKKDKASVPKTVTMEVTPKQAEKISILTRLGKLSLSLRSLARQTMAEADESGKPAAEGSVAKSEADAPADIGEPMPIAAAGQPGAPMEGAPLALTPIAAAQATEETPESLETGPVAGDDAAPAKSAAKKGASKKQVARDPNYANPTPPSQRGGITVDSEVSRVLSGASMGAGVQVMRGSKSTDQQFSN